MTEEERKIKKREWARTYRKIHHAQIAMIKRRHYLAHKKEIISYQKIYQEKNKKKIQEQKHARYLKNRETVAKREKENRIANPGKFREKELKRNYGITLAKYNELLTKQNGKCAICGNPAAFHKRRLHVDHDHLTGKIRGLLCTRCNPGIGFLSGNLEAAIEYLRGKK